MTRRQDEIMPRVWWLKSSSRGFLSDKAFPGPGILPRSGLGVVVPLAFPDFANLGTRLTFLILHEERSLPFARGKEEGRSFALCSELLGSKGRVGPKDPSNGEYI